MAKRELSSTLRNLKFMQRAAQKEEKVKKEDVKVDSSLTVSKKCVIIMEGDPQPGAIVGRMSFRSFNPLIDKLNQQAANDHQPQASSVGISPRENGSSNDGAECSSVSEHDESTNEDLKRKQSDVVSEPDYPNKSPKIAQSVEPQKNSGKSSKKQAKREKFDWNVLKPPKPRKG